MCSNIQIIITIIIIVVVNKNLQKKGPSSDRVLADFALYELSELSSVVLKSQNMVHVYFSKHLRW